MFAGAQSLTSECNVKIVRQTDYDGIDVRVVYRAVQIDRVLCSPIALGCRARKLCIEFYKVYQARTDTSLNRFKVRLCDLATTYPCYTYICHSSLTKATV